MNSDLKLTINVDDKDATFALGDTGTRTKKPDIETVASLIKITNELFLKTEREILKANCPSNT